MLMTKTSETISYPKSMKYHGAKLIAQELISVQPLSQPTGTLHYMDIIHGFLRVTNFDKDELAAYDKELNDYLKGNLN